MKFPDFPTFNIPDLKNSRISFKSYQEWVKDNVKILREKKFYDQLRNSATRNPVNARFKIIE